MSIRLLGLTLVVALLGCVAAGKEDWERKVDDLGVMVDRLYNARIDYKDEVKRALLKKPSRPPTCPVPLPYAAYSTGRLGTTTGDLGQNGWWVAPTTYTTEEITSAVYHDGGQAWWIGDCEDICSAPLFAAYPGPGLGGFGNGIAAEYPLAPANRVRVSLWIKSTSDLPVGGGGSGIVEFCLDGADSSTNTLPLTSFRFGNVYGDDVLVAQAREVTGGTVGNPNSVSRTSLPLTAGRWYHLIMDASLVKGELNDRVKYEVRDTLGNTVWKAEILSLEQAYWLNVSPSKVMAQRLIVRNRVGTGTSAGFYVDDISITTWSNSSPDVPLYCFSTGFEPVAAMRCTEYGYTTNP